VRESWTDERLDDLNQRVSEGFADVREEFRSVRVEMQQEFAAVRGGISGLRGEIRSVQRMMVYGFVGLSTAMLAGFPMIAAQL
jgi:hypothetical protein